MTESKPVEAEEPDYDKTCSEVLEESIWDLIHLGHRHGMTEDEVDAVLRKIIDDRAEAVRDTFKIHRAGACDDDDGDE